MTAAYKNWNRRVRFQGTAGTASTALYSGVTNFIASGTKVGTSGAGFMDYIPVVAAWNGDVWISGDGVDDTRGDHPGPNQFASLVILDNVTWNQPGVLLHANTSTSDGFMISPWIHFGGVEISEFTAGVYNLLGAGGITVDQVNDKLTGTIEAAVPGPSDTLAAWYNDVAEFALVSTLHPSGDPGIIGQVTFGDAAKDFRFGDLATLDNLEVEESTGFPVVISAGFVAGIYTSDILTDPSAAACPWWSALVEVHEEETGFLVSDATDEVGSGEMRWRGVYTREATEAKPGGDFDWTVGSASENVEDQSLRVCGRRGMHGQNTRAKVWTRFRVASVWGDWIEGAWVGNRAAEAMQIKVELDRVSLDYQIRMTRVLLAVAS